MRPGAPPAVGRQGSRHRKGRRAAATTWLRHRRDNAMPERARSDADVDWKRDALSSRAGNRGRAGKLITPLVYAILDCCGRLAPRGARGRSSGRQWPVHPGARQRAGRDRRFRRRARGRARRRGARPRPAGSRFPHRLRARAGAARGAHVLRPGRHLERLAAQSRADLGPQRRPAAAAMATLAMPPACGSRRWHRALAGRRDLVGRAAPSPRRRSATARVKPGVGAALSPTRSPPPPCCASRSRLQSGRIAAWKGGARGKTGPSVRGQRLKTVSSTS